MTADGIGKLLSGLTAIVPTQTIAVSAPTIELTGVAARRVGIAAPAACSWHWRSCPRSSP